MKDRKTLLKVALISACAVIAVIAIVNYYLVKTYGYRVDYGFYRNSYINAQSRYLPGETVTLYCNYVTETPEDTQVTFMTEGTGNLTMWDAQKQCYRIKFTMPSNNVKIWFREVDPWTP